MNKFDHYFEMVMKEEFVAADMIEKNYVKIYKNPRNLTDMEEWMRGIVLPSGDLYIFNVDQSQRSPYQLVVYQYAILHSDIVDWMNKNVEGFHANYKADDNPIEYIDQFIGVERSKGTTTFILAESYYPDEVLSHRDEFTIYEKNFKTKNPNLNLKIGDYENEKEIERSF